MLCLQLNLEQEDSNYSLSPKTIK